MLIFLKTLESIRSETLEKYFLLREIDNEVGLRYYDKYE
jgi:hypothetical protein